MSQTDQQAYDAIYRYIGEQMQQGVADQTIHAALIDEGWDPQIASQLVTNMRAQIPAVAKQPYVPQYQSPRVQPQNTFTPAESSGGRSGAGNMAIGGIVCVIGVVVTVGSMMAANGGGRYVVAWGAIVFGAIQFFKGVAQMSSGE